MYSRQGSTRSLVGVLSDESVDGAVIVKGSPVGLSIGDSLDGSFTGKEFPVIPALQAEALRRMFAFCLLSIVSSEKLLETSGIHPAATISTLPDEGTTSSALSADIALTSRLVGTGLARTRFEIAIIRMKKSSILNIYVRSFVGCNGVDVE